MLRRMLQLGNTGKGVTSGKRGGEEKRKLMRDGSAITMSEGRVLAIAEDNIAGCA